MSRFVEGELVYLKASDEELIDIFLGPDSWPKGKYVFRKDLGNDRVAIYTPDKSDWCWVRPWMLRSAKVCINNDSIL